MMACSNNVTKEVMPMGKSQREIVVAEMNSASVGDKTRPYGINHAVSAGEVRALAPGVKMGAVCK